MSLQGPSLQMIRRHARSSEQMHYGPALQTVTGNYVAGKRKGVIGGVDFGSTGTVSSHCHLLLMPYQHLFFSVDCNQPVMCCFSVLACLLYLTSCLMKRLCARSCDALSWSPPTSIPPPLYASSHNLCAGAVCTSRCHQKAAEWWPHSAAGQLGLQCCWRGVELRLLQCGHTGCH